MCQHLVTLSLVFDFPVLNLLFYTICLIVLSSFSPLITIIIFNIRQWVLLVFFFVYFSFLDPTFNANVENLKFEILSFFPWILSILAANEPFNCKQVIVIKLAFAAKTFGIKNRWSGKVFRKRILVLSCSVFTLAKRRWAGDRVGWKRPST